jgi:surface polysaccharide O-acyltransferase-like enzyme
MSPHFSHEHVSEPKEENSMSRLAVPVFVMAAIMLELGYKSESFQFHYQNQVSAQSYQTRSKGSNMQDR